MPRENRTRYAILGLLCSGSMSGYDLKKAIGGSIGYFWNESFGALYPTLRLLQAQGLVARKPERPAGGRPRDLYRVTAAGRRELRRWLQTTAVPGVVRDEVLLKVFFGGLGANEDTVRHIRSCRVYYEERLAALQHLHAQLAAKHRGAPSSRYWLLTVRMGLHRARSYIAWCDEALAELEKGG